MPVKNPLDDLRQIEAKIQVLQVRADKIRTFMEMAKEYGAVFSTEPSETPAPRGGGRPRGGVSAEAEAKAIELIATRRGRYRTREMLDALNGHGIIIGGTVPENGLSRILSQSARLKSVRPWGWGLVEWGDAENAEMSAKEDCESIQTDTVRDEVVHSEDD